jgi:hypothetical protein
MTDMGRHSPPLDGVTVANGHAPVLVPFAISPELQVRQAGPAAPWPQPGRWHRVTQAGRQMAAHRGYLAAVPVILVNAVAFGAQLGFWRAHVPFLAEAALVALALESIAIYLAWQAHLAQLADDAALRLRLAAYGMALVIGALNYSHFDGPGWRPTVPAVTFGMMSAISPWLWSVHSRRVSRDALKATGEIEPHAVRLGTTRWMWHPWRCFRVMSRATWVGENRPAAAIALPALKVPETAPDDGQDNGTKTAVTPSPVPSESPSRDGHEPLTPTVTEPPSEPSPRPSRQPSKRTSGRDRAIAIIKKDGTLTDAEVAKRAKVSASTARRARTAVTEGGGS